MIDDVRTERVVDLAVAPQARLLSGVWTKRFSTVIWIACAAGCFALCAYVASKAKYSGEDSWLPMGRALDFLHGPSIGLVYQTLFFGEHIKFQYPPTALFLLDLLRWMGLGATANLNLINVGLLILTGLVFAIFSRQIFGRIQYSGMRVPIGPIAFILALRFYPNNLAFQIGQMQILLGLLFLLACWAILHDRRFLAGCLIALAATVKPQFFPLGALALWRKSWRFAAGLTVVTITLFVLSVILYGWRNHLDYLSVLQFLSVHGEYQHLNQSVNGILVRWLYHGPPLDRDPSGLIPQSAFPPYIAAVYIPTVMSSLVMLFVPFFIRTQASDRISKLLEFCTAAVLFTMASPIAWVHHYNILLPVYVVAFRAGFDRWRGMRVWVAFAISVVSFALVGYPWVPASEPTLASANLLQSHVFLGALILVGLLLAEMRASILSREADR